MIPLRRLALNGLQVLAGWFIVWLVIAWLIRALSPDPVTQLAGPLSDPATRQRFAQEFQLDRPLPLAAASQAGRMLLGNWGFSWRTRLPVTAALAGPATLSLALAMGASVLALTISVAAVYWGPGAGRRFGGTVSASAVWLAIAAVPAFVTGLVLSHSGIPAALGLPREGFRTAAVPLWETLVLPAVCLALPAIGLALPRMLASRREITRSAWYRAAVAFGLSPRRALLAQGTPYLLAAVGDAFAQIFIASITGAVAVEYVFSLPGLGTRLVDAIQLGDAPVVMGVVAITTLAIFFALIVRAALAGLLPGRLRPSTFFSSPAEE